MSYFVQIFTAGRYETKEAASLIELHKIVRLETARQRSDSICISAGTRNHVNPYAWIHREWDEARGGYGPWDGFEGDRAKLGLAPHEIVERPHGLVLDLDDAIEQGYAVELPAGPGLRTVSFNVEPPQTAVSQRAHDIARKLLRDAKK